MTAQQKGERMTRIWRFYQHFDPFLVEYELRCTVGGFFSWWWSSSSISGWQVSSWNARNPLFGSWCTRDCKHSRIGKWRGWQKWQNWGWTLKYFPCPSICHELSRLQLPFTVAVSFFWKSRSWNAACRHMSTTVLDHPTENCGSQWGNHPIDARKFNGCNQDQFFESIQDFLWFRSSEVNGQFLWRWFFALSVYPPRRAYERLKPPSWNRGISTKGHQWLLDRTGGDPPMAQVRLQGLRSETGSWHKFHEMSCHWWWKGGTKARIDNVRDISSGMVKMWSQMLHLWLFDGRCVDYTDILACISPPYHTSLVRVFIIY